MIFHSHQAIYFHIGKTAGVSIEKLIIDKKRDARITDHDLFFGYDAEEGIYLQHASAQFTKDKIDKNVFDNYYKFTVVRNPFARTVSVFYYLVDQHIKQFGSFENYVKLLPGIVQRPNYLKGSHHIPQTHYSHINGQQVCDHIGYFEELPTAIDPVREKLGITQPLRKENVHRFYDWGKKPVHEYYTDEMIEIMLEIYASDFQSYNYAKDPKQLQPVST